MSLPLARSSRLPRCWRASASSFIRSISLSVLALSSCSLTFVDQVGRELLLLGELVKLAQPLDDLGGHRRVVGQHEIAQLAAVNLRLLSFLLLGLAGGAGQGRKLLAEVLGQFLDRHHTVG